MKTIQGWKPVWKVSACQAVPVSELGPGNKGQGADTAARKGSALSPSSCLHLSSCSHSVSSALYGAGPALLFQKDGGRKLKPVTCQAFCGVSWINRVQWLMALLSTRAEGGHQASERLSRGQKMQRPHSKLVKC